MTDKLDFDIDVIEPTTDDAIKSRMTKKSSAGFCRILLFIEYTFVKKKQEDLKIPDIISWIKMSPKRVYEIIEDMISLGLVRHERVGNMHLLYPVNDGDNGNILTKYKRMAYYTVTGTDGSLTSKKKEAEK